jgi:glycosyltransferase involved in cell wall biosynthesis
LSGIRTVAICCPQVPLLHGGAELLAEGLCEAMRERGYEAVTVYVPFRWYPHPVLLNHCLAWRLLDLSESNGRPIDLVVGTKFPSYLVRHERKVTWLVHQFRQVYDLMGTELSEFTRSPEDLAVRETIRRMDDTTLGESRRIFAISQNVANRLSVFNGLEATPLYPPPRGHEQFHSGEFGNYVLSVGRLDAQKRLDRLVAALPFTDPALRCVIVGTGAAEASLRAQAEQAGVSDRVTILDSVPFEEMVRLYSECLAVYFAPFQEDYGFVTVEGFLSHKPVVTTPDSGGPLEFVEDGVTGLVVDPQPEKLGDCLDQLHRDRERTRALGEAGYERVKGIGWDTVIDALVNA